MSAPIAKASGHGWFLTKEGGVAKSIIEEEKREREGWLKISEKSLKKVWDNPKDEEVWKKCL